jgi:hypothetical protein
MRGRSFVSAGPGADMALIDDLVVLAHHFVRGCCMRRSRTFRYLPTTARRHDLLCLRPAAVLLLSMHSSDIIALTCASARVLGCASSLSKPPSRLSPPLWQVLDRRCPARAKGHAPMHVWRART